jgi:hypothetical protein
VTLPIFRFHEIALPMRRRSDALQLVVGGEHAPGRASAGTRDVRRLRGETREISRARELL